MKRRRHILAAAAPAAILSGCFVAAGAAGFNDFAGVVNEGIDGFYQAALVSGLAGQPRDQGRPAGESILLLTDKISAGSGIGAWRKRLDKEGRDRVKETIKRDGALGPTGALTECAETAEIPGVFLCQSFFQNDLNGIFGRLSFYAEGGYELGRGTLVDTKNWELVALNLTTQGHDLKRGDLLEAFGKMSDACSKGKKDLCPTPYEAEFYRKILVPISRQYKSFVVLGFSYQAFDTYQSNVGHEMMHAQYFMIKNYQDAVHEYWLSIPDDKPDSDREKIKKALAEEGYDPKDDALMENEFQAYVLEPGAEDDRLGQFVPAHRAPLTQVLRKHGVAPIQVL